MLSKNQTLPDLRLQATYLTNGLGGIAAAAHRRLPGNDRRAARTRRSARCSARCFSADFPTWTLGVTCQLSARQERRGGQPRARPARTRSGAGPAAERGARRGPRGARRGACGSSRTASGSRPTQLGRELAEQRLDAEQKRFEVGMSTSFLVIQAQRDLADRAQQRAAGAARLPALGRSPSRRCSRHRASVRRRASAAQLDSPSIMQIGRRR